MAKKKIAYLMGGKTNQQDPVVAETPAEEGRDMIDYGGGLVDDEYFTIVFTEDINVSGDMPFGFSFTLSGNPVVLINAIKSGAAEIQFFPADVFTEPATVAWNYTPGTVVADSDGVSQTAGSGTLDIITGPE